MCGICGFTGNLIEKEDVLTRMMNRIIHRGPDSAGMHISDGVALGFRRLSIRDLNNGDQPMYNEDKTLVVTFNGEIYNYKELREDLEAKGHIFANNADTEVLLHGYEEYGTEMVKMLRGMFAFVIWDLKTKTMFGARDYFGIKPFYYTQINGNLVYGSEIKSILEYPEYKKEVNPEALENYLTFQYSVLPETFFKGIYKLMPSHCFTYKDGKMEISRYYDPQFIPDESYEKEDLVNRIDEVMQDSVKAHMIADVEVGSFLSSGVDSSYVACHFGGGR
ncbi:MAG: asparagine synthase (glutamine-hydrolyzing), partial [Lachnospiraceae bacterium]|nr:asparagine synthase (glutamine-hydrolyzing) [Lachnospiraceae bacterium]